jgi:prevent-host-death family protein
MKELFKTITGARPELPRLVQECQKDGATYILTRNGLPQAVLVGFDAYRSLKAGLELLQNKAHAENIRRSLQDFDAGRAVTLEEARERALKTVKEKAAIERTKLGELRDVARTKSKKQFLETASAVVKELAGQRTE